MSIDFKKKGQGINADLVFTLIFVFVLGIVFWFLLPAMTGIFDSLAETQAFQDSELSHNILTDNSERTPKIWDSFILVLLVFLFIIMIVLGLLIDTHPLIFGSMIVLLFLGLIIVSASLSNAWELIVLETPENVSVMPITNFTLSNYPYIILGYAMLLLLVVIAKSKIGGES